MNKAPAPFSQLFSATWTLYKQRALPILAVMLVGMTIIGGLIMIMALTAIFGGAMLVHFVDEGTATLISSVLLSVVFLAAAVLVIWLQTALTAIVVNGEQGIIEAFQTGWTYLWPMAWITGILSGIVIAGFLAGILPGILFMVWFTFAFYILLAEDRRSLDALLASREYIRHYWWDTFGKLLVVWLISAIFGLIPFIGQIFSLLFVPFFMLFVLLVYRDLQACKGEIEVAAGAGSRIFWWAVAIIGMILPLAALIGAAAALFTGEMEWLDHTGRPMHGPWL